MQDVRYNYASNCMVELMLFSRIDDEGGGPASGYGESLLGHDGNDSGTHPNHLLVFLAQPARYSRSDEPNFLRNR